MAKIPKDVREALEAAGVKFDDQGNIIDDDNEKFIEDDTEDEDQDDQLGDDEDEDDEVDDEGDDADEDDDEDDEDEEEEPDPQPSKKQKKPKAKAKEDEDEDDQPRLTPKQRVEQEKKDELTIDAIRENMRNLLDQYTSQKDRQPKKADVQDEDDDVDNVMSELRREVEDFRRLKYASFADTVRQKVHDKSLGVSFTEIIESQQWDEFLNTRAYGRKIGEMYQQAVRAQDTEAVVFFFDDFASRYLKRPVKVKEEESVTKQDELDDLAVPDKTKTGKTPRRKKYDFEEDDYAVKLDEAERGVISREDFVKFNDAFETALSKGRVKPSR